MVLASDLFSYVRDKRVRITRNVDDYRLPYVLFKEKESPAPDVGLWHGKNMEDKYLLITAFYQISVSSNFIFLLLGKL